MNEVIELIPTPARELLEVTVTERETIVEIARQGPPGLPGPQGERGEQGVPGATASTQRFVQDGLLSEWVIPHEFTFKPGVRVIDSAGDEVFGEVTYPEIGVVVVSFAAPFSGEAYLS